MKNVLVGLIIGAVIATSNYIYKSDRFSKVQKVILLICALIPFIQWGLLLLILLYQAIIGRKSKSYKIGKETNKESEPINSDNLKQSVEELKFNNLLSDEEYKFKIEKIEELVLENKLLSSDDYLKLKILFEANILSKIEFESKVEILRERLLSTNNEISKEENKFFEGLCVFGQNTFFGYKNISGDVVIHPTYEYAANFSSGLALVRKNGKFGFINPNGELIIDLMYDNAMSFDGEYAWVKLKKEEFQINKSGLRVN